MDKKINKLSKSLSLLLALVMVLGVSIPAFASSVESNDKEESVVENTENPNQELWDSLEKVINKAKDIERVAYSEDGTDIFKLDKWTSKEALDSFNNTYHAANAVYNYEESSVGEVEAAIENLEKAITDYEAAKKPGLAEDPLVKLIELAISVTKVNVSEDGSDVGVNDKWITQKELDDFKAEIKKAEEFLAKEDASGEELSDYYDGFLEVYDAFVASLKSGSLEGSEIGRISGSNIYETSVKLANAMFPEGAKKVVVATANNKKLADALTAGTLANLYEAPLLLVDGETVSKEVEQYLKNADNGVEELIIVGGSHTISDELASELGKIVKKVERVKGSNRFETSVEVAKLVQENSESKTFIVANGEGNDKFVDALSAAAVASEYGYPVLVTSADELVKEATAFLKDSKAEEVFVIGGTTSMKKAVMTDLEEVLSKEAKLVRVSGENRNVTAVEVARIFFPEAENAVYVNGDDNQLVLVAGTYAGSQDSPVLLVGIDVPKPVQKYLPTSAIMGGTIIGSVESVSEEVRLNLVSLVN